MAKMKDVCEKTGLTEKAVRLYMKEGLIHPKTEEGVYRNAYYFSEKDIEVLKDIAVLRNAGFGISDIRQMQEQPEHLPAMIEEKQNLLAAEIYEKKALQSALERLAETERGTTKGLAEGLRPAMEHKQVKKEAGSKRSKYIMVLGIVFLILMLLLYARYGGYMVAIICASITSILGMVSIFTACRYLTVNRRAKAMPVKGKGYVAGVVQNGAIDIAYARAGNGTAGTKEPGAGSVWLLLMMFWNEIRPDNWYPIIQYKSDDTGGEMQVMTFLYGGFKNTWEEGEMVDIAWNPKDMKRVLPLETNWMKRKAVCYAFIGVVLLIMAIILWYLF